MKNLNTTLLTIAYFGTAGILATQTPTHVDQGTTDEEVFLTEDIDYVILIVALLIIMTGWYVLLRRRRKRRGNN